MYTTHTNPYFQRVPSVGQGLLLYTARLHGHPSPPPYETRGLKHVPEELQNLDELLGTIYYCNFSIFQSAPDIWAMDQLFPITPIHRLGERPTVKARLADLTCDSDGVIDKFLGDGVMASFGAVNPSATAAADAVAALEDILTIVPDWHEALVAHGITEPLRINGAVAAGRIVFATIGNDERLEYTVIGEPANLAAKLEKHNKVAACVGLVDGTTYGRALDQGYAPRRAVRTLEACRVDGAVGTLDLVAFDA